MPAPPTPTHHRPSRPTTPLRTPTRGLSPFRTSLTTSTNPNPTFPLDTLHSQFAELSDSLSYLSENLGDLQQMHESLSRFSESFAGFLYGLNMNAYCVEFPEMPGAESWEREREGMLDGEGGEGGMEGVEGGEGERVQRLNTPGLTPGRGWREGLGDATFMTNDTSFVNEPAPVSEKKPAPKKPEPKTPAPARRGGAGGVPRGVGRGARGGRGGSGIARGIPRPRARGASSFK